MKIRVLFCFSAALLVAHLAVAASSTWTGEISDSMCGKDHSMMAGGGKPPNAKECTLECVKAGSKFVFITQGKVYEISNQDLPALKTFAGNKVRLSGEMQSDGKSIKANKLEAVK